MKLGLWLAKEGLTVPEFLPRLPRRWQLRRLQRAVDGQTMPARDLMLDIVLATRGEVRPDDFYNLPTAAEIDAFWKARTGATKDKRKQPKAA